MFKKIFALAVAGALITPASEHALAMGEAPDYPDQPVSFVVPFPPGDLEDVLTRLIAEEFQNTYGVPAAVVNKPGGGGGPFPGAVEVANAPPDGSMIGSFVIGVPVVGPMIGIPELNPDPFEPLGIFLTYPFAIVTSVDAPYKTFEELAAYARRNDVTLGHFGAPLTPTQVTLALAKNAGFEFASDAAFDALDCNTLASGDVDVMNTTIQLVLPCLDRVRVLASVTNNRLQAARYAPTAGELESSLDISLWNGLFVHKDTPQGIRDKIIEVAKKAVGSARAQKIAADTGAEVYWLGAEESASQIKKDIATMETIGSLLGN